ncbi:MAG: hypothetical protein WC333_04125 [Dehalococcoidia bacterium]|jgi:hypothetical protein
MQLLETAQMIAISAIGITFLVCLPLMVKNRVVKLSDLLTPLWLFNAAFYNKKGNRYRKTFVGTFFTGSFFILGFAIAEAIIGR